MSNDKKLSVFDRVTGKIIADLERGVLPWQKPWNGGDGINHITRPLRHTGEPYNGVNILLLWDAAATKGYQNPTWMTFKQAEEYGGKVKKGEKAAFVVYATKLTKTEPDEQTGADVERQIPFLRGYNVFNVEQVDGLPEKFLVKSKANSPFTAVGRLERVEYFIKNTGAVIKHGIDGAYYSETLDQIHMPTIDAFRDSESYYATLAHEATHWVKHEKRLNRDFGRVVWGDEGYAKEELVAEIGSAFLCADLGITPETREDHAAYIGHWLKILKNDRKFIFSAAAHATRAVEYLKGLQPNIVIEAKAEVAGLADYKALHVSEPLQIGKHQWRLLIERHGRGKCTRYEWKKPDEILWRRSQEWPSHDINDTYLGLPRGLSRLYERETPALTQHGLVSIQNQPQQRELAI